MCYLKFDGLDKVYERSELRIKHNIRTTLPILEPKGELQVKFGILTDIKQVSAYVPITAGAFIPPEEVRKREQTFKLGTLVNTLNVGLSSLGAGMKRQKIVPKVPAVFISANLNGKPIRGWIGFAKFNEGDEVEVVVAPQAEHDEVYAILRPKDKIISIMPTCQQGHKVGKKHTNNTAFWFILIGCPLFSLLIATIASHSSSEFLFSFCFSTIFCSIVACLAVRSVNKDTKKGIFHFAESIFATLGWKNTENIDLLLINKRIIQELHEEGKYAPWSIEQRGFRPSPLYKYSSRDGFFYYDDKVG